MPCLLPWSKPSPIIVFVGLEFIAMGQSKPGPMGWGVILQDEFKNRHSFYGGPGLVFMYSGYRGKNWKALTSLPPVFIWLDVEQESE